MWAPVRKILPALIIGVAVVFIINAYTVIVRIIDVKSRSCTEDGEERPAGDVRGGHSWGPLTMRLVESAVDNGTVVLTGRGVGPGGGALLTSNVVLRMAEGGEEWRAVRAAIAESERHRIAGKMAAFRFRPVKMQEVDCFRLFVGHPEEQEKATGVQNRLSNYPPPPQHFSKLAADCARFLQTYSFITSSLTLEEEEFPIAFSILAFKDSHQVVDLLRAIYRPQNYYCVHADLKAKPDLREAVEAVARCLPNVFLASRSINVVWGSIRVIEPEINCMEDLWKYKKWKYFINLTGQEFPLKTNWELVQILKAYNGANNLEGTRRRLNKERYRGAGTPPAGIMPTKGSVHITASRDLVDFILHTSVAKDFLTWSRRVNVPDEVFFSSLNHNPHLGIKGTYLGDPETHPEKYPFMTRYKNWGMFPFKYPCAGKRSGLICVLTIGDLPLLDSRPELFANKFHANYSQVALNCLAEKLFNNTRDEFLGLRGFDVTYYAKMPFVTNMVKKSTFNRTIVTMQNLIASKAPPSVVKGRRSST